MTYGHLRAGDRERPHVAVSHSAELVRGNFLCAPQGPLIRPVSPKASLRLDGPPSPVALEARLRREGEKGTVAAREPA